MLKKGGCGLYVRMVITITGVNAITLSLQVSAALLEPQK